MVKTRLATNVDVCVLRLVLLATFKALLQLFGSMYFNETW